MKKIIISIVCLIAVLGVLLGVYFVFREKTTAGEKDITIEIVDKNSKSTVYELTTKAEYLEQAMNEADGLTYETTDGMVMVVNGVRADYTLDGAYWGFFVNNDYCNYGIAQQPVNDNDHFVIKYTKA